MKRLGAGFKGEEELTEQEVEVLKEFFNGVGFKVFEKMLRNKFNREYRKLRNTQRRAESYERINGFLDGVEYVINSKDEYQGQAERPPKE